jgi:hypothetical protein
VFIIFGEQDHISNTMKKYTPLLIKPEESMASPGSLTYSSSLIFLGKVVKKIHHEYQ